MIDIRDTGVLILLNTRVLTSLNEHILCLWIYHRQPTQSFTFNESVRSLDHVSMCVRSNYIHFFYRSFHSLSALIHLISFDVWVSGNSSPVTYSFIFGSRYHSSHLCKLSLADLTHSNNKSSLVSTLHIHEQCHLETTQIRSQGSDPYSCTGASV